MSLITSHGPLLHTRPSEEPAATAEELANGSEKDDEPAGPQSSLEQVDDSAAATSGSDGGSLPSSAERGTGTEEVAAAADKHCGESDMAEPDIAAAEVQSAPPEDPRNLEAAQHGALDGAIALDSRDASSAGDPKQQEASLQQAEKEISIGVAETRKHCLMVSFADASLGLLHAIECQSEIKCIQRM